jgi:hypothetical protein
MEQVIFLKDKEINSVFAFFTKPEYREYICFDPIGGHSGCCIEYAFECEEATEDEFMPIYRQLTNGYGYDLQVIPKHKFNWCDFTIG